MPLVLHGGTGIPADMIKKAIDLGVSKINVNTECQLAFRSMLHVNTSKQEKTSRVKDMTHVNFLLRASEAIKATVKEKMELFGSVDKA